MRCVPGIKTVCVRPSKMKEAIDHIFKLLDISKKEFEVVNDNLYRRLENGGDLSMIFGESYMAGEWKTADLAAFLRKVMVKDNYTELLYLSLKETPIQSFRLIWNSVYEELKSEFIEYMRNTQSIELSKRVGEQHYDIPDILYKYMLDSNRQYTCAYWKSGVANLEDAQTQKLKLVIDKLQIPEGAELSIVELGCGWGGLANAISKRYPRCTVTGASISKEQIKYCNDTYGTDKLKYIYCDYRELLTTTKKYDRIVSVGMLEHVGIKNYDNLFKVCNHVLAENGIFVLHNVTRPNNLKYITGHNRYIETAWGDTYIFPGAYIPTLEEVAASFQSQGLMYHHIQNLSISYAKTLEAWYNNFVKHWDTIRKSNEKFFTPSFYRMWEFYLLTSMILFEKKSLQLSQFVLTKKKYDGMYVLA